MSQFDIEVECPACGAGFSVPRLRRGSTESCPVCNCDVRVGDGGEAAATAPSSATRAAAPAFQAGAPTGFCYVCLEEDIKFDITKVSDIVDELDGLVTLETRIQLAKGHGVLAAHVLADVADNMVERLCAVQIPAFAVDEGRVPHVERQLPMVRIHDVQDGALYVQTDAHGTVQSIAWPLVAGGFCTRLDADRRPPRRRPKRHVVTTSGMYELPDLEGLAGAGADRKPNTDPECTLLVRGKSGSLFNLRFRDKGVRYTYLGARQSPSSGGSFPLFLGDVLRCCPHAFFPSSMRAVAAGEKQKMAKLKQPAEYVKYLEWVCCCVGAGAG